MKRILALALIIGVSSLGLVGCDQKSTEKEHSEVNTPNGSVKKDVKVEETRTGDQKKE